MQSHQVSVKKFYFIYKPDISHDLDQSADGMLKNKNKQKILDEIKKLKNIVLQNDLGRMPSVYPDSCQEYIVELFVEPNKLQKVEPASTYSMGGLFSTVFSAFRTAEDELPVFSSSLVLYNLNDENVIRAFTSDNIGFIYPMTAECAKLTQVLSGYYQRVVPFFLSDLESDSLGIPDVFFTPEFKKISMRLQEELSILKKIIPDSEEKRIEYMQTAQPLLKKMNDAIQSQVNAARSELLKRQTSEKKQMYAQFVSKSIGMRRLVDSINKSTPEDMFKWIEKNIPPLQKSLRSIYSDVSIRQVDSIAKQTQNLVDACDVVFSQLDHKSAVAFKPTH